MSEAKAALLRTLAEMGVTEQDYDDIRRAEQILDEMNARLRERRAWVRYKVTFIGGSPEDLWGDTTDGA